MSEEEMRNIIYLKNKPISSCKDLHKYFIGRHNEPIIVYLTPKFEIEFENNFGKLECLEKENKKYKVRWENLKKWIKSLPIDEDNFDIIPECIYDNYGKVGITKKAILEKMIDLEEE